MNIAEVTLNVTDMIASTDYGTVGEDHPFNFSIKNKDIMCFMGGKIPSLLFRLLMGQGQIKQGQCALNQEVWSSKDDSRHAWNIKIGIGLRGDGILSNMTLKDNLLLPMRYHGLYNEEERMRRVEEEFKDAEIPQPQWDSRPHAVSWETRKRVLLARSVIMNPSILLLDSPTEFLSWESMPWLINWIKNQAKKGRAIAFGTESLPFAMAFAEKFYLDHELDLPQLGLKLWGEDWRAARDIFLNHWEN